ncbi:hypothetical protein Efla_006804 [Eimeria flavescens]
MRVCQKALPFFATQLLLFVVAFDGDPASLLSGSSQIADHAQIELRRTRGAQTFENGGRRTKHRGEEEAGGLSRNALAKSAAKQLTASGETFSKGDKIVVSDIGGLSDRVAVSGLPVSGRIHFFTEVDPIVQAGEEFGAVFQITGRGGSLLRSFAGQLYFICLRLDGPADLPSARETDNLVFSGSTSIRAVNGLAVVTNWRITKTGLYHIRAMCDGCVPAVSRPMRVVSGEPVSLRLLQQPRGSRSGECFSVPPVLEAADAFENSIPDLKGEVFIRLIPGIVRYTTARELANFQSNALIGTLIRPFTNGSAEFPDLVVTAAGLGHRLLFSLLSPATGRPIEVLSQPFDVDPAAPAEVVFLQHPPEEVGAGLPFTVEVSLIDSYGNPATGPHTIELSAGRTEIMPFALVGTTTASISDENVATFQDVAFSGPNGEFFIQAACTTCETQAIGRSYMTRVRSSSYIVATSCKLLREGSKDAREQCVVTITLESLSQQRPKRPVLVRVLKVESVAMRGGGGLSYPLSITPESLHFDPVEEPISKTLNIKAIDDNSLRYSTDCSDPHSALFIQHYRVHLQAESEDIFWHGDSVEWVDEQFITIKVVDNDKQPFVFSSLGQGPLVIRRGDSISYGLSLGFVPDTKYVAVTVEAAVGITVKPIALQFNQTNWNLPQTVSISVTDAFPAAPFAAPRNLPSGLPASKVSIKHKINGDRNLLSNLEEEELIFFVVEDKIPRVLWEDTTRAVLAGEYLELPFVLSTQPVDAVSVTLNCREILEPSSQVLTLTPHQWRTGATFRLKAIDDGETNKPGGLETCAVVVESGDERFNLSAKDFSSTADQSFGGLRVDILVYKQLCVDGMYKAICPCLPGQQCHRSRHAHCPAGNCSLGTNCRLPGTTACMQCPGEHFCLRGSYKPQLCPEGSTAAAGSATCQLCTRSGCGLHHEARCPAGRYISSDTCIDCPEGFFCPVEGLKQPQPCPAGTYSSGASITCKLCPSGSFCPTGSFADMQRCQPGTYSGAGASSCKPCPAGFRCLSNSGSKFQIPCGPGEYSEEGVSSCLPCPRNFACPTPFEKVRCEQRTQFAPPGQQLCKPCPKGFSCENEEPVACQPGFDSHEGEGKCTEARGSVTTIQDLQLRENSTSKAEQICPEGTYYQGTGCFPYGPLGMCANGRCFKCPRGYYCPPGAPAPLPIEEGYYSPQEDVMSMNQAIPCPRGAVCPAGSWVYQLCEQDEICQGFGADKIKCPPGTFWAVNSTSSDPSACMTCPAAHYCPNSTELPIPCPLGTFSKTDGAASEDACILYPPGFIPVTTGDLFVLTRRNDSFFPYGWGGAKLKCSPGYFSRFQMGTSALHCEPCPARMVCDSETNTVKTCPKGHFCPTGTALGQQRPCLPGTYSPSTSLADSGECISCLPGYYCPQGAERQYDCPKGAYCPKRTQSPNHFPCPGGTYNNKVKSIDIVECLPCPAGKYCPAGTVTPSRCPNGTYGDGYGTKLPGPGNHSSMCRPCPSGYACPDGRKEACGKGKTSKEGAGVCILCPAGSYCPLEVTTYEMLKSFSCSAGRMCSVEGLENLDRSEICPAGHYCPLGTGAPIKCPSGTYNSLEGRTSISDCLISRAGTYAEEGTEKAEGTGLCEPGYFCPAGSSNPKQVACPMRTFNPSKGGMSNNDCLPCPAGSFCGVGTSITTPCPEGYYCPVESSAGRPCPAGTYRDTPGAMAEQDCTPCPLGKYCGTPGLREPTGLCAAGTLCLQGARNAAPRDMVTGVICPAYGYCPAGTTHVRACEPGKFNPYEGGTSDADCRPCFQGFYCTTKDDRPVVGKCSPGYVCPEGSSTPTSALAPKGSFAPEGSAIAEHCRPGTWAKIDGAISCDLCPAGRYCDEAGMRHVKDCRKGMYCPEGSIFHINCPPGTYNNSTNRESIDDCLPCDAGKYCQEEELHLPSGNCTSGYFCARGSISIAPMVLDSFGNGPCPAGSYCPEGTQKPVPCPPGTYQPSTHASRPEDCIQCPAGWYCGHQGLKAPGAKCTAGYYCEEGETEAEPSRKRCPTGHMCPAGSPAPVPCLPGSYQDMAGRSYCNICKAGFYCPTGAEFGFASKFMCPTGSFCPAGTKSGKEFLCPPGFYNPQKGISSVLKCSPCLAGHYCDRAGLSAPTGICAEGFYCTRGARYPNEVLKGCIFESGVRGRAQGSCEGRGSFKDRTDAEELCSNMELCVGIEKRESLYFMICGEVEAPEEGSQRLIYPKLCVEAGLCPIGKVCPAGTGTPQDCPRGHFCASKGLKVPSGKCHEGFYCGGGVTQPASPANACPPGYYCPAGTVAKIPCPVGTYLPAFGAWNVHQCQDCPPGQFCSLPGLSAPSGDCSSGFYCEAGSTTPADPNKSCKEGHYCVEKTGAPIPCAGGQYQSAKGARSCVTCPGGSFCPPGSVKPQSCPLGFYCPAGTSHQFQYPCPQGTYGKVEGAASASSCQPCEGGQLCYTPGTGVKGSTAMTNCPAGYYCADGVGFSAPQACTYGEYCPEQSAYPRPCPAGFYCANEALEWPTGRCRGGYICKQRATTHSPERATAGEKCPELFEGYPCPAGYFCHGVSLVDSLATIRTSAVTRKQSQATPFQGLTSLAVNQVRNEVVVADYGSGRIIVVSLSTGAISEIYNTHAPAGVAVSIDGNFVYASLPGAGEIVSVNLQNSTTTDLLADNLNEPWGLCLSLDGERLYVAEAGDSSVSIINLKSKDVEGLTIHGLTDGLNSPRDVAISPDGRLYIADTGNHRVLQVSETKTEELAMLPPVLQTMNDIGLEYKLGEIASVAYGKLNAPTLFLADATKHVVWKMNLDTGHLEQILGTGTPGFSGDGRIIPSQESRVHRPMSVAVGEQLGAPTRTVIVLDGENKRIRKVFVSPVDRGETAKETACPEGTFSNSEGGSTEEDCIVCPAGYACQGQGQQHVTGRCAQGYYCPEGSKSVTAVPCPAGFFCQADNFVYNVALHADVQTLEQADFTGDRVPARVTDGNSDLESGWISKISPSGHVLLVDLGDYLQFTCTQILSDFSVHYLHQSSGSYLELLDVNANKKADYEQTFGEITARKIMLSIKDPQVFISEIIVTGTSSSGPADPTPCPRGWYQELMAQTSCKICLEGYYCADSSVAPELQCPEGHFCPEGTFDGGEHPCPLGTYNGEKGAKTASECITCPAGQFCGSRGLTKPSGDCFAGFYCKGGAWSPAPSALERNPDGDFYFSGGLCPSGHYCPEGADAPKACPEGTSSSALGGKRAEDCIACLPGYYCSNSLGVGLCAVGYYCTGNSTVPTPSEATQGARCPKGHYCPEGSYVPQPCPPGTFSEGGTGECTLCTEGWQCPESKLSSPQALCPAGHACAEGTVFAVPCPPGTLAASKGSSACDLCSGGFVCDEAGLSLPSAACPEGFVCARGASMDMLSLYVFGENSTEYGLCPPGNFCPASSTSPTPCNAGTFQDGVGASECKPCSPGFACTESGLISPTVPCDEGFYCVKGSETPRPTDGVAGDICPAGWHCPVGSFTPQACPPGKYTEQAGLATCSPCPSGYECPLPSSTPLACSDGLVCPEGSARGIHCPYGSYKVQSSTSHPDDACAPCPRGKYCRAGIIAGPCAAGFLCGLGNSVPNPDYTQFPRNPYFPVGVEDTSYRVWLTEDNWKTTLAAAYGGIPCPSGYYCSEGATEPSACNRGSFRLNKGGRWPSDCSLCPLGYYCLPTDAVPVPCPKGYYCGRGTQTPSACPKRYYNPKERQSSQSSCILCPAGMSCSTEGTGELSDEHICPLGHYCTQGSSTPTPCPAGFYNPQRGSLASSACQPCPGGIFCANLGTPSLSVPCPGGYYCPANSAAALPCPAGWYCPEGSAEPKPCPGGSRCPLMTAAPEVCPRGFFCPEKAAFAFACPAGSRMNPYDVLQESAITSCELCRAGTYSDAEGLAECTPCHAGHICADGCHQKYPQDLKSDGGMKCQPGHYCPEGSSAMRPCPAGTYNPDSGKAAIESCQECPLGSYTDKMGQSRCILCGGSTFTEVGFFECKCLGANRVYEPSSGACVCQRGHERIVAGNSALAHSKLVPISQNDDCTPLRFQVYSSCGTGDVPDHAGGETLGYFGAPNDLVATIQGRLKAAARDRPYLTSGNSLKALSARFSRSGRHLSSSDVASVQNPLLCIMAGSTVLWRLEAGDEPVYPVYLGDSLLNSLSSFDAGSLRQLRIEMESGAPFLLFAHTFNAPGVAVFASNRNFNSLVVISVVEKQDHCGSLTLNFPHPPTAEFIEAVTVTAADVVLFGRADWTVACLIFVITILLVALVTLLQLLIRKRYWTFPAPQKTARQDEGSHESVPGHQIQQSILCCKETPAEEPEISTSYTDLDPRVFQAVYWKLLDSMSLVKDQMKHLRMQQDKLVELEIDIASPLKASILPTLSEASEKKSWAAIEDSELSKKLSEAKQILLLRKGALEEAVHKACEAMTKTANERDGEKAGFSKWSSEGGSQALEDMFTQASLAATEVADLKTFASILGSEQDTAVAQALKRLQAADAATQTSNEIIFALSNAKEQQEPQELTNMFILRMRKKLEEHMDSKSVLSCSQAALMPDKKNLHAARRSISLVLSDIFSQRNELLIQQQASSDELVIQQVEDVNRAMATLQEDLFELFFNLRSRFERAHPTKKVTALSAVQKDFEQKAEELHKAFTSKQQEDEAYGQELADRRAKGFGDVIQDFLVRCRTSLETAQRVVSHAEQHMGSKRESMEIELLQGHHNALLQAREEQLKYLQRLQRQLIAEEARNEYLTAIYLQCGSAQGLAEKCKAETEQNLKALASEQNASMADLKAAMGRECTRAVRLSKERARAVEALLHEEQTQEAIRHEMKLRVVTDELACLYSAQTKLDEGRRQHLRSFSKRLVAEAEDLRSKLRVILRMPDSVEAARELQQCLDACNRNVLSASESAARALTSLHEAVIDFVAQELNLARTSLIRAMELDDEEVALRINSLRTRQREIHEEEDILQRSFLTSVAAEDIEVESEIALVKEKLATERIKMRFIEDERDAFMSRLWDVKATALCQGHEKALDEAVEWLKRESLARVKELARNLQKQVENRESELAEEQETRRQLALERISAALDAREKCTSWAERQARHAGIAARPQQDVHQLSCQINDELFSALLGVAFKSEKSKNLQNPSEMEESFAFDKNFYLAIFTRLSPIMAPASVALVERTELLKKTFQDWGETAKALHHDRTVLLSSRFDHARARQERLHSAEELLREKLTRTRENEWISTALERAAAVKSALLPAFRKHSVWEEHQGSNESSVERHLKELQDKQAKELEAFETHTKNELEKGACKIRNLQGELQDALKPIVRSFALHIGTLKILFVHAQGEDAKKAKEANEQEEQLTRSQKKQRIEGELQEQRELLEAQWRITRKVEFEALRKTSSEPSSLHEAEKQLLISCQEAELRDLKELLGRQRLLIMNMQRHESRREAEKKFHFAAVLLGDLSAFSENSDGPWSADALAAARKQVSQEIDVRSAQGADLSFSHEILTGMQVAADQDKQILALKERHFAQLAEVSSRESPKRGLDVLYHTFTGSKDAAAAVARELSFSDAHQTQKILPSKQVAEWQQRMRSGSSASILITRKAESPDQAKVFSKQLEHFASAVAKAQRVERDRQQSIMKGKLRKRAERQQAKRSNHKKRTVAKSQKSHEARKSVLDFKLERMQAARQKEKRMRAQFRAEKVAFDQWHPIFWNIIEEEAKHGSYEQYEEEKTLVARGPTMQSIERIIKSVEEGSFLRVLMANLELLAQACKSLAAAGGDSLQTSEAASSSDATKSDEDYDGKSTARKSGISAAAKQHIESDESEASKSGDEGSSSEESSSSDEETGSEETSSSAASQSDGASRAASDSGVRGKIASSDEGLIGLQELPSSEQGEYTVSNTGSETSVNRKASASSESSNENPKSENSESESGGQGSSSNSAFSDEDAESGPAKAGAEGQSVSSHSSSSSAFDSSGSSSSLSSQASHGQQEKASEHSSSSSEDALQSADGRSSSQVEQELGSRRSSTGSSSSSSSSSSSITSE